MIRWLHISDLHLGSKGMSTEMLRDELPMYLRARGLTCDYVFCTGDIRTANMAGNEFKDGMAEYIRSLCDAVGVPVEKLFIVPGNHDVNIFSSGRTDAIKRVMFDRSGYYSADVGRIDADDMAAMMAGEEELVSFLSKIYPPDRVALYGNPSAPHFCVETADFNVLHVDSTISYCPGQDRSDFIVGTGALYDVVRRLNPAKPTVLLTHYPFFVLLQDERSRVSTILQRNGVRLWLAGHEHEQVLQKIHYVDSFQAGELRLEDGAKASVLIGEYDERSGHCCITAHAWYPEGWAQYPLVDLDNKAHPERYECYLRPKADSGESLEMRLSKEVNKEYYYRLPGKVEQPLLPSILAEDEVTSLGALLSETWHSSTPHIILLADGGMGKTTMLLDYCRHASEAVLYIPAERLAALGVDIEQYCIDKIYNGDADLFRSSLFNKLSSPTLTLFIDGLNEVDVETERRFIMEIQRLNLLKGLRVLVASRSNFTVRYSMPGYLAVELCPLEDAQIQAYFSSNEWADVLNSGALHRLLQNPMMVTVYKEICSVIDEYRDVEFLDWILPVKNATDLFHDYYVAQLALMMKRGTVDGEQMVFAWRCLRIILPAIAYSFELSHHLNYEKGQFRELLSGLLSDVSSDTLNKPDAEALLSIQEHYRLSSKSSHPALDYLSVLDLLTNGLHLLYKDSSTIGFPHQMYRDYLAAQWIVMQSFSPEIVFGLWNLRNIPLPVVTHVRQGSGAYWNDGLATLVHEAGRGRRGGNATLLINNLFECFPFSADCGVPDYSGLDLKSHILPDCPEPSSRISLKDTEIDSITLGFTQGDTIRFSELCMSEDRAYLAAVDTDNQSITIFDLREGQFCLIHDLGKHISKAEFYGNHLFVVAGGIHLFTRNPDWRYVGVMEEKEGMLSFKLKGIIEKEEILYFYYNNRLVRYRLADCHRLDTVNGKLWEDPAEGADLSSLTKPFPFHYTAVRQTGVLTKVGDDELQVLSYGDGRLVVLSGNEVAALLVKGVTQLLDASISSDGSRAATLSFNVFGSSRRVQLWDLNARAKLMSTTCPECISRIHLSETGEWLMGEDDSRTWVFNCKSGEARWYDEHFVSNHANHLLSIGDCVLRKKGHTLYQFNLQTGEEKEIESPVANPSLVCFLNNGSIAAVDKKRQKVYLISTRNGAILTLYPDGSEIVSVQALKNQPFIAVVCKDCIISLYHTGTGQRVRKLSTKSSASVVVVHPDLSLIADTNGLRTLETHNYFEKRGRRGKKMGWWYDNPYSPNENEPVISGDILDIAFNMQSSELVAILSNGRIMFFNDKYCRYHSSFSIITAFDVNAYDFRGCICEDALKEQLVRNGALVE